MKVSCEWLKEWISPKKDAKEIASILTMSGLEVDQLLPAAGAFEGVIVAEVVEAKPHPDADKLTVCQVHVGQAERVQVVCGAANVRSGLKVALAKVGAKLPNDFNIESTKLRGVLSQGMLCSAVELGMTDKSEGILELNEEAPIGLDLREYFKLDDYLFDIELTPNRGDCLSIQGVARELAAKLNLPMHPPKTEPIKTPFPCPIDVEVQAVEACPCYMGRVISNISTNARSPLWLKERLRRAGIRSVHPVVDVTQYVMLELGQPLHAFDTKRIHGKLVVRDNFDDESLTLLDGQTIELQASLMIADEQGPLALAGIMGGEASAVNDETTSVFIESAFFSPNKMAGVARRYGLLTDASYRYERGVDPLLPARALDRATALIQAIAGGEASEVVHVQQKSHFFEPKHVQFRPAQFLKRIGINMPETKMKQILHDLGFQLLASNQNQWTFLVPTYRFDIALEEDIIEELVRVDGYDKVLPCETSAPLRATLPHPIEQKERQALSVMQHLGYHEAINYSFVDPKVQKILFPSLQGLLLANPISPELAEMRVSLWPGLLASMLYNLNRQQDMVALFECGRVFDLSQKALQEIPMIAGLLVGLKNENDWGQTGRSFDFYDIKGDLETLLKMLSIHDVTFVQKTHEALHPGQTAALMKKGALVGWCGVLHPSLSQEFGVNHDILLFECRLDCLTQVMPTLYQPISKFPKIKRDLAFLVDKALPFSEIERVIRQVARPDLLKDVQVFDVYEGETIPKGKKSLAINLTIQSAIKTLEDEEIQAFLNAIIETLTKQLNVILRDGS